MKKFDSDEKVIVKNLSYGKVGITNPANGRRFEFPKHGATVKIPYGVLEELIYDPGVDYMLKNGIVYIEDMEAKIALGLEEEETKEPTNIKILSDAEIDDLLNPMKRLNLEKVMKESGFEQNKRIAYRAIEKEISDLNVNEIIFKYSNINPIESLKIEKTNMEVCGMTPLSKIYSAFLSRILEDDWSSAWTQAEIEADMYSIMAAAIPYFKFPRKSLEFSESGFEADLDNEEIQIIANYMKCEWLNRNIMTWEHVKPLYEERDFSQANLLSKLKETLEAERTNALRLEAVYYRAIKHKPFDYTKLAKQ